MPEGRLVSGSLVDDGQDVARRQDQILLVVVLDLGAAVLGVQHLVTDRYIKRNPLRTGVVPLAGTDSEDLALLRLLLRSVRDDETGLRGLLYVERPDQYPVVERLDRDRHLLTSPFAGCHGLIRY